MTELTKRQSDVLKFIQAFIASHGYSPSTRDIAEHFAMHVNAMRHTRHSPHQP
jgi:SOS-response transcriptional repressor LexA